MSPRLRILPALLGAAAVLVSGLTASPADAAPQTALVSVYGPIHENVTFSAAGGVTPVKLGRRVDLQVKAGARWKTIDTVKQDEYGGLTFTTKVKRTGKAKDKTGYEWRHFRVLARASGNLKQKVSASKKVKVMLDPKVYYKVLRATVQHTADANMPANGCGIGVPFVATNKTDSGLGKAESGKPKWRGKRLADGTIETMVDPGLATTWHQDLSGCRYFPSPAQACTTTRIENPSGDGKEPLGVRVQVPKRGSKGSVMFFTRTLSAGFSSADDSVCNVPWMRGGEVPAKIRTKSVARSKLLGKRPFTVVNQGQVAWAQDTVSGKPADLKLRFTESVTLQRVDVRGRALK